MDKIRVGVICGGQSAEHEVSLQSAQNIVSALDRKRFDIMVIGIDRQGRWQVFDGDDFLIHADDPERIALGRPLYNDYNNNVLIPGPGGARLVDTGNGRTLADPDVVFPIVHGTGGEDGALQGLLRTAGIAFVGSDVAASAIAMDKDIAKRLLRAAGLAVAPFRAFDARTAATASFARLTAELGGPLFVKPTNQGSSVGVSRVDDAAALAPALAHALAFDHKVLVEAAMTGREIECAVLGNADAKASVCGEIVLESGFYSYAAKYIDANAGVVVPADINATTSEAIRRIAVAAFHTLGCAGLARVDFFLTADGRIIVNEVNTLPGFTRISMYPKLWAASGLSYPALVTRLVELALERHAADRNLRDAM